MSGDCFTRFPSEHGECVCRKPAFHRGPHKCDECDREWPKFPRREQP